MQDLLDMPLFNTCKGCGMKRLMEKHVCDTCKETARRVTQEHRFVKRQHGHMHAWNCTCGHRGEWVYNDEEIGYLRYVEHLKSEISEAVAATAS